MTSVATQASCPIVIKIPVSSKSRVAAPPVAARLQARRFPARDGTAPEKTARKELLAASALARKSAIAAAHNARVTDVHDTATLMQTQIMEYHRSTIDRRLQARLPPGSRNLAFFSPSLALTAADPIPPTPVPAQPQEAEALRAARLEERASKAKKFVERVDTVAEKNEERKALLAAQTARKLEAAEQKRARALAAVAFRGADAGARVKAAALAATRLAADKSVRVRRKLDSAAARRDRVLELVSGKAAFFNIRAERAVAHARLSAIVDARAAVARVESKMAAAEYLRELDLRLRRTRAALANERAAHVLERRRFSDHVAPVIGAARIRADQQLARERRERVLDDVSAKARDFIRRAVLTCAFVEVRDARRAERGRARIEARLSAACDRKEAYLLERVQPRSPATTTDATIPTTRPTTARGRRRASEEEASPVAPFGYDFDATRLSLSVPTSPVA